MIELEPLQQWQQGQGEESHPQFAPAQGQLYAIDGGVFKVHYDEESVRPQLWTWQGKEGHVVMRTGFEVGECGGLYDRIYDIESEQYMVPTMPRFTVEDLTPVTLEQATQCHNATSLAALAERFEHINDLTV